jgi:outer membrane protein OmpA-like peptidoglycan-associated protein
MLDELDDGARIGVWTALGVVALLLFGLLGGIAIRQLHESKAGKPAVVAAVAPLTTLAPAAPSPAPATATAVAPPPTSAGGETLLDVPLGGQLAGTLYFASGVSNLGADSADAMKAVVGAVKAAGSRKVLISGFHDATGDPAKNAELAKERAKAVREALKAGGVAADRIGLRKPETTTGDGNNREARRVEVRLMP